MIAPWVDGREVPGLDLGDRGLLYGDGLFETLHVAGGRPRLLPRHLQRLVEGCRRLGIPLELSRLEGELLAFCADLGTGVCRLTLTRGSGVRGYAPPDPCRPRHILTAAPLPTYPAAHAEIGIRLFPCRTRLGDQPLLAGLKHLNRLEQVLARAEWQSPDYAEGLLCDQQGRAIEGVFSNLFMAEGSRLLTPQLERCGVAGVMRAEILQRAASLGLDVEILDIPLPRLLAADELFFCNSLYGIWPVRTLGDAEWQVGPVTRKLQDSLQAILAIP